jgi:hypothetical protein
MNRAFATLFGASVLLSMPGRAQLPAQHYTGSYRCVQGTTDLELTAIDAGNARFAFGGMGKPQGSYIVQIFRSADGTIKLSPLRWERRPMNYSMVGATLRPSGKGLVGRIDSPRCGSVTLVTQNSVAAAEATSAASRAAKPASASDSEFVSAYLKTSEAVNQKLNIVTVMLEKMHDLSAESLENRSAMRCERIKVATQQNTILHEQVLSLMKNRERIRSIPNTGKSENRSQSLPYETKLNAAKLTVDQIPDLLRLVEEVFSKLLEQDRIKYSCPN